MRIVRKRKGIPIRGFSQCPAVSSAVEAWLDRPSLVMSVMERQQGNRYADEENELRIFPSLEREKFPHGGGSSLSNAITEWNSTGCVHSATCSDKEPERNARNEPFAVCFFSCARES